MQHLTTSGNAVLAVNVRSQVSRRNVSCAAASSVPPAWPGYVPAPRAPKHAPGSGPKPISLIGSTGSIGTQTLDIVAEFPDQYKIVALSAGGNVALLADQVRKKRDLRGHATAQALQLVPTVARRLVILLRALLQRRNSLWPYISLTSSVDRRFGASGPAW